jgi:hypothetical protein
MTTSERAGARRFFSYRGTPCTGAVARLNIEHFRGLLATETEEAKRQMILRLLVEEEAKLAALGDSLKGKKA